MRQSSSRPCQTKIVATLGPSSNTSENIHALADAGASVFRMNFSHGTHGEHAKGHSNIREAERNLGRSIAILADLQGPKLRIGVVPGGDRERCIGDRLRFLAGT